MIPAPTASTTRTMSETVLSYSIATQPYARDDRPASSSGTSWPRRAKRALSTWRRSCGLAPRPVWRTGTDLHRGGAADIAEDTEVAPAVEATKAAAPEEHPDEGYGSWERRSSRLLWMPAVVAIAHSRRDTG